MINKTLVILAYLFTLISVNPPLAAVQACALQEIFIQSGEAHLFCRTIGRGKPLLVIHGGPGMTQDYLLPYLYKLGENNFVIFYDQRGCGESMGEITPETIQLKTFIEDIDSIRRAFHFKKISILGHSWGGFLAMHYALAYPGSVKKLILSNSIPASSDGFSLFVEEYLQRIAPFQEEMAEIYHTEEFERADPKLVEHLHRIMFRTYCFRPEKVDLLNLAMTPFATLHGAKVYALFRETVFEKPFDLHIPLEELKIPTLIIHGKADPIPSITAQALHESIPNSQFILMEQCGHFPYVEEPEVYFDYLKTFLK